MQIEEIKVEEAELLRDMISFENALHQFSSANTSMVAKMNELNSTWAGPAKDAFLQQFQKDCEVLDEFQKILQELNETIRYADELYSAGEDFVRTVVKGIKI